MTITKKSYFSWVLYFFFNMQQYLYQKYRQLRICLINPYKLEKNYNASERFNTFNAKQSRLDMEKQ